MKNLILFTFIFSFNSFAQNSRSPAVLDGTCNLDVPTTITTLVNGQEMVQDRVIEEVLREQCAEVKKCMYSADEEAMVELKTLEAVACNNNLTPVTTKTPGAVLDNNYNGGRQAKPVEAREVVLKPATQTTRK